MLQTSYVQVTLARARYRLTDCSALYLGDSQLGREDRLTGKEGESEREEKTNQHMSVCLSFSLSLSLFLLISPPTSLVPSITC